MSNTTDIDNYEQMKNQTQVVETEDPEEQTKGFSEIILVLILLIFLNNFLLNHARQFRQHFPSIGGALPDAIITVLLGVLIGGTLRLFGILQVIEIIKYGYQNFFIIVLLPPILFEG